MRGWNHRIERTWRRSMEFLFLPFMSMVLLVVALLIMWPILEMFWDVRWIEWVILGLAAGPILNMPPSVIWGGAGFLSQTLFMIGVIMLVVAAVVVPILIKVIY